MPLQKTVLKSPTLGETVHVADSRVVNSPLHIESSVQTSHYGQLIRPLKTLDLCRNVK